MTKADVPPGARRPASTGTVLSPTRWRISVGDERLVVSTAWGVDRDENALTPVGLHFAKESRPSLRVQGPRLRLYRGEAAAQDEGSSARSGYVAENISDIDPPSDQP